MFPNQLSRRDSSSASLQFSDDAPVTRTGTHTEASLAQATRLACDNADVLDAQGLHAQALEVLDDALTRTPDDPYLYFRRGTTLFLWGRMIEAKEASLHAVTLGLENEALYRQLCWCCCWAGSPAEGKPWMEKASNLAPDDWKAEYGLGIVGHITQKKDEAVVHLERAVSMAPNNVTALNALVLCHLARQDPVSGEAAARRAISADSSEGMAWANLGVALGRQLRFEEAWPAFERALELEIAKGVDLDVFVNYCNCMRDAGRMADAIQLYGRFLTDAPSANGHGDYAFALLTAGRFQEGWKQYEFRWASNPTLRRYPLFDRPMWNGQDLRGRTILLWVEQGFGDIFQFARYAPLVKATGARVILMVREGVTKVMQSCPGVDVLISRDDPLPAFDFHCPIMSLPRVFGTTVETIPAPIPYLRASTEAVDKWRARLPTDSKRRVGIVWAGNPEHPNDTYRSIALGSLRPLLACEGVTFVSLQKGPALAQLNDLTREFDLRDIGSDLQDFDDTLAVIEQLDLVICVDTAVAHLAGAAGKPTWLLITDPADFRWLEGRTDSPWYPSFRLFRQDRPRDWTGVIADVAQALSDWVEAAGGPKVGPPVSHDASAATPPETDIAGIDPLHRPGFSDIAYTRYGILQYFPEQPVEGCSLRVYGEYLQGQVDLMQSLIASRSAVLDVWPGIGAHTIALSRLIGIDGRVLTFEPNKRKHRVLRRNVAANGLANVTVLNRDIASECRPGVPRGQVQEDLLTTGGFPSVEGAADTIDSLRLLRLDLVRIGDGARAGGVIDGAAETLWRCRPRLFIAVADRNCAERLCPQLSTFGYRRWLHETPLFNSANFNLIRRDLFLGATALALVAVPEEVDLELPPQYCYEMT